MSTTAPTPSAILDFALDEGARRLLAFTQPLAVHAARELARVRDVLEAAEREAKAGRWVVGYVAYDAAPAFDAALVVPERHAMADREWPYAWFAAFSSPREVAVPADEGGSPTGPWTPRTARDTYVAQVQRVLADIRAGRFYQLNHTIRLRSAAAGVDGEAWFHRLRRAQRCDYAAFLDLGDRQVLSLSPELFFRRTGDTVVSRPMKGTSRRGRTWAEDEARREDLRDCEKSRAENVMIVDLIRNDLSRIARPDTVRVDRLFDVERYPTVLQMTSTVSARARPGTSLADVFATLFPCGSITGAPKVEAMKAIATLEGEPRGVYCGAIGVIRPGGDATFNVAIRTIAVDRARGTATVGVGGGIVADSTPEAEHDEALLKARFLEHRVREFRLLETMRLESGRYPLLERHLDRLERSAAYFGRPFSRDRVREALARVAAANGQGLHVVRLQLDSRGEHEIGCAPFTPAPAGTRVPIALAPRPVSRHDVMLFHKTTSRAVYDEARASAPGAFDVLLRNEEGELTEFARGNLVVDLEGRRYTPPVDCGLLAGTYREELLATGRVEERVLHLEDLESADRICFVNGLRGEIDCLPLR